MSWFRKKSRHDVFSYNNDEEDVVYGSAHSLPTDTADITEKQLRTVFWLNLTAFLFQTGSALAVFFLIDNSDETKKFPFYTNYPLVGEGGMPQGSNSKVIFSLNPGWLSGVFLSLSALDHLLVCTVFRGIYEKGLSKHINIFRWVEYIFSASLMRILVGVLCGVNDLHTIFLQFGLTACTMIFGLVFELENRDMRLVNIKWYLYWIGFIPHFFSWLIILGYFYYSLSVSSTPPPDFVYAIIVVIFVLDLTFAVILGFQWLGKCCFRPYVNGEIAFIILSFTSKNALAWINFFGGNR